MISQSLNLSLFAIYKLIKRPLPSKRHGEFSECSSGLEETLMMRLITKEKYVLRFDFLMRSLKVSYSSLMYYLSLVNSNVQCPMSNIRLTLLSCLKHYTHAKYHQISFTRKVNKKRVITHYKHYITVLINDTYMP